MKMTLKTAEIAVRELKDSYVPTLHNVNS